MPPAAPYSISDLARITGVSVRTIRYYLAQGLIPAVGESGPGAHYGEGHLGRLRLIRRLQQQHLPLAEIRTQLASLTDEQVTALAAIDAPATGPAPETSALDYVRSVLAGRSVGPMPAAASMAPGAPSAATMPATREAPRAGASFLKRLAMPVAAEVDADEHEPALPPTTAKLPVGLAEPAPPSIERSQWERLSLGPNLELHVRRPLSRLEQKRVERLITIARQVLKEEQP